MFKMIDGKMTQTASGKVFDSFAMMFDGTEGTLLCSGTSDIVAKKHMIMTKADSMLYGNIRPILVVFDKPDEEVCEAITRMYTHTGYSKIWLKNNGYM